MRARLPGLLLAAALLAAAATGQEPEGAAADPELERVSGMLEQARKEIREFREAGGEEDDPEHPGRRWARELWRFRDEHPGTPAAARATTESVHFLLHAGRQEEAVERALTVAAGDGAWGTLIGILFEAAELREDYGIFVDRARELAALEEDPAARASLRFRLAQAHWVEGDLEAAEGELARLAGEAPGADWAARVAAAREEMQHSEARSAEAERGARDLWQRPRATMDALGVEPGDAVADVGSGGGYFTFLLARRVGSAGRVYAVDIDETLLERLGERADELGLGQIETVLGADNNPRLPATAELEAILVVDTYHEMRGYDGMLAGMYDALAPGGRLAIVDTPDAPGHEREAYHERHKIPVELVIEEAARAGFRLRSFRRDFASHAGGQRLYLVVFDKPEGDDRV